MQSELKQLVELVKSIQIPLSLEEMVHVVANLAAEILNVNKVTIRILDSANENLMVAARAGTPIHIGAAERFRVGEGLMGWVVENNQPLRLGNAQEDKRFLPRPGMLSHIGSYLGAPLRIGPNCIGVLSAVSPKTDAFNQIHEDLLVLVAALSGPYVEIARLNHLNETDPLTGALNRRGLTDQLDDTLKEEYQATFSLAMLDIDHFKTVNDDYGHGAGDFVLQQVAKVISQNLRESDQIIRYGGEEFLIRLPGSDLDTAVTISERIRKNIQEYPLEVDGQSIHITVSVGVATLSHQEPQAEGIKRADEALYTAKNNGRNRVEIADNPES